MKKAEYQRYLASREWALLKEQVRARSGGKCERCEENEYEQTHHLTYERVGHERLADLQALCAGCHLFISAKSDEDPLQGTIQNVRKRVDPHGLIQCFCGSDALHDIPGTRLEEGVGWAVGVECDRGHRFAVGLVFVEGRAWVRFEADAETTPTVAPPAPRQQSLDAAWDELVTSVMKRKAILGSVLKSAAPLRVTDGVLRVAVSVSAFHLEMLRDTNNAALINELVQRHMLAYRLEVVST